MAFFDNLRNINKPKSLSIRVVLNRVWRCPKEFKDFEDMENMDVSEVEVTLQDSETSFEQSPLSNVSDDGGSSWNGCLISRQIPHRGNVIFNSYLLTIILMY